MNPFDKGRRHLMTAAWMGAAAGVAPAAVAAPRGPAPSAGTPGVFEVTRFGAVGDGRTPSTKGLQRAIDACAAAGGGTVLVPAGCYVTGALFLRSHVHLHVAQGATLAGSENFDEYPPIKGREEGVETMVHASMLTGQELEDVAITGLGKLDGRGVVWWHADQVTRDMRVAANLARDQPNPPGTPLQHPRPRMINLVRCRGVVIEGLTVVDGPGVNIQLVYCQDVLIDRATIYQNRPVRSSEAIIVDSSQRVTIIHCRLSAGADAIGIKSGYNEEGRRIGLPTADVLIDGCQIHKVSSAVVVGSETAGGIRNITLRGCVIRDCLSVMRVRSPRGRGGVVERIHVSDLIVDDVDDVLFKISNFFDSVRGEGRGGRIRLSRQNAELARSRKAPIDEGTPTFRDFRFSRLTVGRAKGVALIEGLPERFIQGVTLSGIAAPRTPGGIFCNLVADLRIDDLTLGRPEVSAVDAREVQRLEIHRLTCERPPPDAPVIYLENVARAFIHGCDVGEGPSQFPWLQQEVCRQVTIAANTAPPPPAVPPPGGDRGAPPG
jgi:polygalacturonase